MNVFTGKARDLSEPHRQPKAQRTYTWLDAELLIEAEMKRVHESPDWTTRQQEPGYLRALLLLRRYRRER